VRSLGRPAGLALAMTLTLAAFACSGDPPSLNKVEWYFIQQPRVQLSPTERLSVFAAVDDPDGADDLEALYVAQDEAGLVWKFNPDTWTKTQRDSTTWIGSNTITMADGSPLPRGAYRVLVTDRAGESDERSFALVEPPPIDPQSFSASLIGDGVSLKTPFPQSQIVFLDSSGATLGSLPLTQGANSLSVLLSGQGYESLVASFYVLSIDEAGRRGLMSPRLVRK
jgi:hypothetical protein